MNKGKVKGGKVSIKITKPRLTINGFVVDKEDDKVSSQKYPLPSEKSSKSMNKYKVEYSGQASNQQLANKENIPENLNEDIVPIAMAQEIGEPDAREGDLSERFDRHDQSGEVEQFDSRMHMQAIEMEQKEPKQVVFTCAGPYEPNANLEL